MALGRRWSTRLLLLAVAALLGACAGRNAGPDETPAPSGAQQEGNGHRVPITQPVALPTPAPALPAPSGLTSTAPKHTQFVEADLSKIASQFDLALPNNLVVADGGDVDFTPNFTGRLGGCAYCIYDFNISGYDRNAQLRALWATAADDGNIFFGLANWDKDRWDWFAGSAQPKLNLPTITPYISFSGELLLVVLCCGEAQRLSSVRIGGQPPSAAFTIDTTVTTVPAQLGLDAATSTDADGSIVKYEWDLNGDGSFELDQGSQASFQHEFTAAGLFNVTLRVRDDDGLTGTTSLPLTACAEWTHTLGAGSFDGIADTVYDGQGSIYVSGFTDEDDKNLLLAQFDLAGELQWLRSFDCGASEECRAMTIGPDGSLILALLASPDLGSGARQNLLMQVWSPEGELQSSRYFDNAAQIFPNKLTTSPEGCYLWGNIGSFDNAGVLNFNSSSGQLEWVRVWTHNGTSSIFPGTAVVSSTLLIGQGTKSDASLVGQIVGDTGLGLSAMVLNFEKAAAATQFELISAKRLDNDNSSAGAVIKRGKINVETIVAGAVTSGGHTDIFISNLKSGGSPNLFWNAGNAGSFVTGMTLQPDGDISVIGRRSTNEIFLLTLVPDAFEPTARTYSAASGPQLQSGLTPISGICGIFGGDSNFLNVVETALDNSGGSFDLAWINLTMTEISLGPLNIVDLPGTVTEPQLVLDRGSGNPDAILFSRFL